MEESMMIHNILSLCVFSAIFASLRLVEIYANQCAIKFLLGHKCKWVLTGFTQI